MDGDHFSVLPSSYSSSPELMHVVYGMVLEIMDGMIEMGTKISNEA